MIEQLLSYGILCCMSRRKMEGLIMTQVSVGGPIITYTIYVTSLASLIDPLAI